MLHHGHDLGMRTAARLRHLHAHAHAKHMADIAPLNVPLPLLPVLSARGAQRHLERQPRTALVPWHNVMDLHLRVPMQRVRIFNMRL